MKPPTIASKPCVFLGDSLRRLRSFPPEVRARIGYALYQAQAGREALAVKALKGFGGRGVLEVVEDNDGNAYRTVYTLRFARAVYVLHAFQKKSTRGIATPKREVDLIKRRLQDAERDHATRRKV